MPRLDFLSITVWLLTFQISSAKLYTARCGLNLSLLVPPDNFAPRESELRGLIDISDTSLKLAVYQPSERLLSEGFVLHLLPGSAHPAHPFSFPYANLDKVRAKLSSKETVTPTLQLKKFSEGVGCTKMQANGEHPQQIAVWSCDREWFSVSCDSLQEWNLSETTAIINWCMILLTLVKISAIGWVFLKLVAKPNQAAKIFPFYYSAILLAAQEGIFSGTLSHYLPLSSVIIGMSGLLCLILLSLPVLSYIYTDSGDSLHSIAQHEATVEGEYVNYFQCRKVFVSWTLLFVFGFLSARSFFYSPSSQMYVGICSMTLLSLEIYLFALQDTPLSFLWWVIAPNILTNLLPWVLIEPFPRLWETVQISLLHVLLFTVLYIQCRCEPRLWCRCRLVDHNEYLFKPKTLLLDDLLREHRTEQEDVCGICLAPIHVATDVLRHFETNSHADQEQAEARTTNDSVGMEAPGLSCDKPKVYKHEEHVFQLTKCGHVFHMDCLLNWTDKQETCPICRQTLMQ